MNQGLGQLLVGYRARGAIVDTNLLLVYVVGSYRVDLVPRFKRTQKYSEGDFEAIRNFVHFFQRIVVTPNILTEVSNLAMQLTGNDQKGALSELANLISNSDERFIPSREIVEMEGFQSLGLTDSSIEKLAPQNHLVLTDDLPLYSRLAGRGIDVINYYHLRFQAEP